jgi:2-keto-4-pentenoate hydratase/2-oxohepta-3-ene-1,7-dioic acid hydratase in catechol pathway
MKLYTFQREGEGERLGAALDDSTLVDLARGHELVAGRELPALASMQALIESGARGLDAAAALLLAPPEEALAAISDVRIRAPLPRPRKIRGFSVFERHLTQATDGAARTLSAKAPDPEAAYAEMRQRFNLDSLVGPGWRETPAYYYADCTAVTGQDETVVWPAYSQWIDFELEVAAVIGAGGKDIAAADAMDHIFGYTLINDLSARDAQFKAMATGLGFAKGKDFDGSNPCGPCIVTADEIPDPYALRLRVRVNGETWSDVNSAEAYWRFPDCIAYASQSQTIYPGEIFTTGCAPDCCSLEQMRPVNRGDRIELEAERIGVLRTIIG